MHQSQFPILSPAVTLMKAEPEGMELPFSQHSLAAQIAVSVVCDTATQLKSAFSPTAAKEITRKRQPTEDDALQRSISEERNRHRAALILEKEQRRKAQDDLHKFRWQKLLDKVTFRPPSDDYYDSLPIQPGFQFFSCLLKAPRASISTLKINIPETILFTDRLYYLQTAPAGVLSCTDEVDFFQFLKKYEDQRSSLTGPLACAAAILRGRGETEDCMYKQVIDWVLFRQKLSGHEIRPQQMIQQFIRSQGGRPTVLRLFYHRSTKETAVSYAYQIVAVNSYRYPESELMRRCTVDFATSGGLEVIKQAGAALKPLEEAAEHIVAHLNRGYNIRIEKIVLDFLRDDSGKLYFCGCKGFLLDNATLAQAIRPPPSPTLPGYRSSISRVEVDPLELERRREEMEDRKKGSFVRCKLCRLQYPNSELAHLVSVRMLMLFKMHAAKREDLPMDTSHLKVTTSDLLSQSVRVCPYCYILVTSEFLLVNVEKAMATALNIPYKEEVLEEDMRHLIQLQFLPRTLIQWRVLIHFHCVAPFSDRSGAVKLVLKLHDYRTEFQLKEAQDSQLPINTLKAIYFFSNPKKSIRRFLSEFQAEFSIESDSHVLVRGISPILTDFPATLVMGSALTEKKHISMFTPETNAHCDLIATIGLSCDHECEAKYVKASLTKVLEVYLPEEHYCNTDPLPVEWMEHFGEEPVNLSFEDDISVDNYYLPSLTTQEVKRMQDITSPYPAPLNQLYVEPAKDQILPSEQLNASSVRKVTSVRSKDSTFIDFDGLETEISIKELYTSVQSFLESRPEQKDSTDTQMVRRGSRKIYRKRRTNSTREGEASERRREKRLSVGNKVKG